MTEAEQAVSVEFDLTPEEWVDVAVEHSLGSELFQSALRKGQAAFAGIVGLLAILGFAAGYPALTLVWLFAGAVGTVLLPRSFERAQRKQYTDIAAGGITNGMFGTHRVRLSDDGIVDETDAYVRLTRWHAVDRVVDGPGAFMIYFGSDAFLPVPHSAFRDSATLRAFSEYFFKHLRSAPAPGSLAPPGIDEGGTGDAGSSGPPPSPGNEPHG